MTNIPLGSICLGSRESPLALAQTKFVMGLIQQAYPEIELSLKTFKTKGDKFLEAPLSTIGDKGLFVKELEDALLQSEIDLAVHSLKDMLSILPEGLALQSIAPREDARDVLLNLEGKQLSDLPPGAVVGTASLRRVGQLKKLRPDLLYQNVRGNIQTRFGKLEDKQYDALVLAAAGIRRMGWLNEAPFKHALTQYLDPFSEMLPAVGQGILAVEYRQDNQALSALLSSLSDSHTECCMQAERAFLKELEGGCRLPVAAYAYPTPDSNYHFKGGVYSEDGVRQIEKSLAFTKSEAEKTGIQLAQMLLADGARDLLSGL